MAERKDATGGIPDTMREMAENSVAQARRAFEQFMQAAHRTLDMAESSTQATQASARDLRARAAEFAEANVGAAFELAERLVHANDAQEFVSIQQEFLRRQTEQMRQQMQELGSQAASAAGAASGAAAGSAGSARGSEGKRPRK